MDLDAVIQNQRQKQRDKWGGKRTYQATAKQYSKGGSGKHTVEEIDISQSEKEKQEGQGGVISLSQRNNNLRRNKRAKHAEGEETGK